MYTKWTDMWEELYPLQNLFKILKLKWVLLRYTTCHVAWKICYLLNVEFWIFLINKVTMVNTHYSRWWGYIIKKQKIKKKRKETRREITVQFEPLGPYERLVLWFSCHFGRNKCLTQWEALLHHNSSELGSASSFSVSLRIRLCEYVLLLFTMHIRLFCGTYL
jgi:hypothetical protein